MICFTRSSLAALAVLCGLAAGCANLDGVARGDKIYITMEGSIPAIELPQGGAVGFAKNAGNAVAQGAAGGALLGIQCGVGAVVCSPLFAGIAATAGLIGAIARTPHEDSAALVGLRAGVEAFAQKHDPGQDLLAAVTEKASGDWTIAQDAAVRVRLRLFELKILSVNETQVKLVASAQMQVERDDFTPTRTRPLVHQSPPSEASLWAKEDADHVSATFDTCYRAIAEKVATELRTRSGR